MKRTIIAVIITMFFGSAIAAEGQANTPAQTPSAAQMKNQENQCLL